MVAAGIEGRDVAGHSRPVLSPGQGTSDLALGGEIPEANLAVFGGGGQGSCQQGRTPPEPTKLGWGSRPDQLASWRHSRAVTCRCADAARRQAESRRGRTPRHRPSWYLAGTPPACVRQSLARQKERSLPARPLSTTVLPSGLHPTETGCCSLAVGRGSPDGTTLATGGGWAGSSSGEPPTGGSSAPCRQIPAGSWPWRSPRTAPCSPRAAPATDRSRSGMSPPASGSAGCHIPSSSPPWRSTLLAGRWPPRPPTARSASGTSPPNANRSPCPDTENGTGTNVSAFDPSGNHLIAFYDSGAAFVWDMDPDHWKQQACAVVGRSLTRGNGRNCSADRRYHPACH